MKNERTSKTVKRYAKKSIGCHCAESVAILTKNENNDATGTYICWCPGCNKKMSIAKLRDNQYTATAYFDQKD